MNGRAVLGDWLLCQRLKSLLSLGVSQQAEADGGGVADLF